ncbi:hypothetical protein GUJ93_ZPchr0002g26636 [Zizania palustris]|uniref:BED-type domain-containing protein n=1 Tax=Zizania palustris TaxID=103762 RepID=A0A8J5VVW4_ZIZPA|nr:hypothetical protein GUJ93_ZPchr0002g26636 [Zizania palustris]
MSTPGSSSQPEQASQQASAPASVEETQPRNEENTIDLEDEEIVTGNCGSKRKLTSTVWNEFTRVKVKGVDKAKCMWCSKQLSGDTKNGTKHLHSHLKVCIYRKRDGGKVHSNLRFGTSEEGQVSLGNYIFDQDCILYFFLVIFIYLYKYYS